MNMRRGGFSLLCAVIFSGCAAYIGSDAVSQRVSQEVAHSERLASESLTMSRLTALERSLSDFILAEGRVPKSLEDLIPRYIAEIPESVLGIRGHKDSNVVTYYRPHVINGGLINGAELRDRGGWGYAFNGKRVILFVNCTHATLKGEPWFRKGTGLEHGSPR